MSDNLPIGSPGDMRAHILRRWGRRDFVKATAALAGAVGCAAYDTRSVSAEPPPEIKKIRLVHNLGICLAPQYLADELLRLEGFTDIQYVEGTTEPNLSFIARGEADLTQEASPALVYGMDRDKSLVALAGIHGGCYELMGNDKVRSIRDLKGKTVAVGFLRGGDHILISSMLAYVGIDPKHVNWLANKQEDAMRYFVEGRADAFMGFAPQPQELREKKIGHVVVDTGHDRPWSQYFCCVLTANRDFVSKYPIATKRALRAFLKGADMCAEEPQRVAQLLAAKGYETRYAMALDVLKSLRYDRWRHFDPADTLRFYALRLHEVGMIKSDPNKLIAEGANWRFLNELKGELKA